MHFYCRSLAAFCLAWYSHILMYFGDVCTIIYIGIAMSTALAIPVFISDIIAATFLTFYFFFLDRSYVITIFIDLPN